MREANQSPMEAEGTGMVGGRPSLTGRTGQGARWGVGGGLFMGESLITPDHNFPLKPGRVEAGGNMEGLQTLE